ncbi:hypothetical protein [Tunicatimonas pelagia]|uniref:hypothetical protein n=1 Tax=Tunicatimonas pelagia TaxID=931531 RepID=UPI002665E74F|nr:hypothetical protein [Tunicatimonas pelagia]WKN41170.1 hypothetical protein P0M28_19225 [Tunicatimonas pelagia]
MDLFDKGNYKIPPDNFTTSGEKALDELTKFQEEFGEYDTDTTVNTIRDSIVARYLGYDLVNFDKHGFDARKSSDEHYLEVKQCSIHSTSWGGTWNDTNDEKALAFSDNRLYTAIALWRGASDLQAIVYGQNPKLGEYLKRLMDNRPSGSRSTQSISLWKIITEFGFNIYCPPDKTKEFIVDLFVNKNKRFRSYVNIYTVKTLQDL